MTDELWADQILSEARAWLGTPYRHRASVKAWGCDCLGLVRGVWAGLYTVPAPQPPAYTPNWRDGADPGLMQALNRTLRPTERSEPEPGDVLGFAMGAGLPIRHLAILDTDDRLLHAYWGRSVTYSHFGNWWKRRFRCAWQFPQSPDIWATSPNTG